jgi:hypothetical protein
VHRSTWEPRPTNRRANHTVPVTDHVHRAFAARPVAVQGAHDKRWDSWLLQRVTGHHRGTTDENLQWAACKWGINDNLLRAVAAGETTWFQSLVYPSGRCVQDYGCGDLVLEPSRATKVFCTEISRYGHDYRPDYGRSGAVCPRTFGITGVMSWRDPRWGRMPDNQNGTFPFNRNSTAFAAEYVAAHLRGCYEGWQRWLGTTGTRAYRSGDMWGCVGAWYAGAWHSAAADEYAARVRDAFSTHIWLSKDWRQMTPPCDRSLGCPRGGP